MCSFVLYHRKELAAVLAVPADDVRASRESANSKGAVGSELRQFLVTIAADYGIDPSEVQ